MVSASWAINGGTFRSSISCISCAKMGGVSGQGASGSEMAGSGEEDKERLFLAEGGALLEVSPEIWKEGAWDKQKVDRRCGTLQATTFVLLVAK